MTRERYFQWMRIWECIGAGDGYAADRKSLQLAGRALAGRAQKLFGGVSFSMADFVLCPRNLKIETDPTILRIAASLKR
jgi:hypothetical protein